MKILVTGSAGHLGEALMRSLPHAGYRPIGFDIKTSAFTHHIGSITDRHLVSRFMRGMQAVLHTATLHKPHLAIDLVLEGKSPAVRWRERSAQKAITPSYSRKDRTPSSNARTIRDQCDASCRRTSRRLIPGIY